ncbi:hypothetical protein M153_265300045 [Pseudoloma neurophilia]|uniref:Uncharacterized protein n=1 Tax=Pseudoloma neurophilia TaxID=146866 RepID=A0A0R0LTP2_9MICR|nr:hypothetical protein M153_265300045 [Pseudoloma neurophilia]
MSFDLSPSTLKQLEQSLLSSDLTTEIDETQNELNELDQRLNISLSEQYKEIIQFCTSLNETAESLDNLIKLNDWTNEHLISISKNLEADLQEYKNTVEIEKNIDKFTKTLKSIELFESTIIKIETSTNAYEIVQGVKSLENSILGFKGLNFHHKFNSKLFLVKSNTLKATRKEAEAWFNQNMSIFESFGCDYLTNLKSLESCDNLIFDPKYNYHKDADVQKIYDLLYVYSSLKNSKSLIDKFNSYRQVTFQIDDKNLNSALYKTIGFFILEFYLLEINPLFDLKNFYKNILIAMINHIKNIESDVLEQLSYIIALKQVLKDLKFQTYILEDEILQLTIFYFQKLQADIENIKDIPDYIEKISKLKINNQDIETLMIKNIDDVLLKHYDAEDEQYEHLIDKIEKDYKNFTFRAVSKYRREKSKISEDINSKYLNTFDKILQIKDIDQFHEDLNNLLTAISKNPNSSAQLKLLKDFSDRKLIEKDSYNADAKRALVNQLLGSKLSNIKDN